MILPRYPHSFAAPAYKRRTPLLGQNLHPSTSHCTCIYWSQVELPENPLCRVLPERRRQCYRRSPLYLQRLLYTQRSTVDIILVEILLPSSLPFVGVPVFVSPLEGHNIVGVPPKGVSVRIRRDSLHSGLKASSTPCGEIAAYAVVGRQNISISATRMELIFRLIFCLKTASSP